MGTTNGGRRGTTTVAGTILMGLATTLATFAASPLAAQTTASAGAMRGVGIGVFTDRDYRGHSASFRADVPDLARMGLDDAISSLEIADGEQWEACELPEYGGRCQLFTGNERDLKGRKWNDMISSLRRVRSGGIGGGIRPPMGEQHGRVTLYAGTGYRGAARTYTRATPDLGRTRDRAYSARVEGTWLLCGDASYQSCRAITGDVPDLGRIGLAGRIASLRPSTRGGGLDRATPPRSTAPRLVVYSQTDFRGSSRTTAASQASLGTSARSAVVSGRWLLCDAESYRGNCIAVNSDVDDVRSIGMGGIRSAQRLR